MATWLIEIEDMPKILNLYGLRRFYNEFTHSLQVLKKLTKFLQTVFGIFQKVAVMRNLVSQTLLFKTYFEANFINQNAISTGFLPNFVNF